MGAPLLIVAIGFDQIYLKSKFLLESSDCLRYMSSHRVMLAIKFFLSYNLVDSRPIDDPAEDRVSAANIGLH